MNVHKEAQFVKGYALLAESDVVGYDIAGKEKYCKFEVTASKNGHVTAGVKHMYQKEGAWAYGYAENMTVDLAEGFGLVDWVNAQFAWVQKNQKALQTLAEKLVKAYEAEKASKATGKSGPVTVTKLTGTAPKAASTKASKAAPEPEDDGIVIEDTFNSNARKRNHVLKV